MMILYKFRLDGKCGIVTGAGLGIGRAIAQGLVEAGAAVFLASASPLDALKLGHPRLSLNLG